MGVGIRRGRYAKGSSYTRRVDNPGGNYPREGRYLGYLTPPPDTYAFFSKFVLPLCGIIFGGVKL